MLLKRWNGFLKLATVGLAVAAVAIAVAIIAWAAPANDIFPGTTISTTPYSNSVDTTTATSNNPPSGPDDPIPSCMELGGVNARTVWYQFTSAVTGTLVVDTFGSNYDTVLSAYTFNAQNSHFTEILNGCNDDWVGLTSQITITATANVSYNIMVSSFTADGGTLSFHANFYPSAANDNFANATTISTLPFTGTLSQFGATTESSDPTAACSIDSPPFNTVWYKYTPPTNTTVHADTYGSTYDTILSVYTGSSGNLTEVMASCSDDASGTRQSETSFPGTAGTTYYFMIQSYQAEIGNLSFHVDNTHLTLVKVVTNDNGGTKSSNDFPLTAAGPTTLTGITGNSAVTYRAVTPGTYALSEATTAGYTAGPWSCNGGSLNNSSVTLTFGQDATCTIANNDQPAQLTLTKVVNNTNGGTKTSSDFTLIATGPSTISGVSGSGSVTNATVNAGTYLLSEVTIAGYVGNPWSCPGFTVVGGAQVTIGSGQSATCSVTNIDQAARLTLVKVITNNDGGTKTVNDFPLTAAGPTTITGVSGTLAVLNAPIKANNGYVLSEQTQPGYTSSAWSCSGGSLNGNTLTVSLNTSTTCTITNDDQGPHLTLVKIVSNTAGGSKTKTDFPLTAAGPTTITGVSGTGTVTNALVRGLSSYALSEQTQTGYAASAWSCLGGTLNGSNVVLALGENVTCSITNSDQPHLTLVKHIINNDGGTRTILDFPLKAAGPTTITGTSGAPAVTNASVQPLSSYVLSEQTQVGYTASAWSCVGGTLNGSSVSLSAGQNATCSITNDDIAPRLTLVKVVTNTAGGNLTVNNFPLTAAGPTTITGVSGTTAVTNAAMQAYSNYVLSEQQQAGYTAGPWNCTGGGNFDGLNLMLGVGENVTCTITNQDGAPNKRRRGQITSQ